MTSDQSVFRYALLWSSSCPLSDRPSISPLSLPEATPIASCQSCGKRILLLDSVGCLWESLVGRDQHLGSDIRPLPGLTAVSVVGIACNDRCAVAWTNGGLLYAWEGTEGPRAAGASDGWGGEHPTLVASLTTTKVVTAAVGKTHCAAVDGNALCRPWATVYVGQWQVVCGDSFTAVCTTGGYVYIFGVMGSHVSGHSSLLSQLARNQSASSRGMSSPRRQGRENRPYTFPDMSSLFAISLAASNSFLSVLTDDGAGYIVDDCLDLIRLPVCSEERVESLAASGGMVLGVTQGGVYEWRGPLLAANSMHLLRGLLAQGRYTCPLYAWNGVCFRTGSAAGKISLQKNTCGLSDICVLLAEEFHKDLPLEFFSTVTSKGREKFVLSLLESCNSSQTHSRASLDEYSDAAPADAERLSSILTQKLRQEQSSQVSFLCSFLARSLTTAFSQLKSNWQERNRAISHRRLVMTPTVMSSLWFKLRIARVAAAWTALKQRVTVSNLQRAAVEQRRLKAAKRLLRVVSLVAIRHAQKLFVVCKQIAERRKLALTAAQTLRRRTLKSALSLQRRALLQWSNCVIRFHISGKGVQRLVHVLDRKLKSTSLQWLQNYAERQNFLCGKLGKVLRRASQRMESLARARTFTAWKSLRLRLRHARKTHTDTACRALLGRLRLLLKRRVLKPVLLSIREHASRRAGLETQKLQAMCFATVLSRVRIRVIGGCFGHLARCGPSERTKRALERLCAVKAAKLRGAMTTLAQFAVSKTVKRTLRMGLALSKTQDKLKTKLLKAFFSAAKAKSWWPADMSPISPLSLAVRSASLRLPGPLLTSLNTRLNFSDWSSPDARKDYCCPDDHSAYLQLEDEESEQCSFPAELDSSPPATPRNSRQADLETSQKRLNLSLQTNPKKATSPPVSPKHSVQAKMQNSLRARRIQYTQDLRRRKTEIAQRKSQRLQKDCEVGELGRRVSSSTNTDSLAAGKGELVAMIAKVARRRMREVMDVMEQANSQASLDRAKSLPEPDVLEKSWKSRLQRIGLERLRRILVPFLRRYLWESEREVQFDDVEGLRTLAEILVWSEQNKKGYFVYVPLSHFCDFEIPKAIISLLSRAEDRKLAVQIIQTMSIICLNLNEESILWLLQSGDLQALVAFQFDFSDEETGEYYITWVKGLALRVTPDTLAYFFEGGNCPLLERVCCFYNHHDSMVCTAARTAAISIIRRTPYTDKHEGVPAVLAKVHFLPNLSCLMRDLLMQIHSDICALQFRGIRSKIEDLVDILFYCKDLILVRDSVLTQDLETCLFHFLVLPVILGTFVQDHMQPERLATQLSVGLCLILLDLFKEEHFADVLRDCLVQEKLPAMLVHSMRAAIPSAPEQFSPVFSLQNLKLSEAFEPSAAFTQLKATLFPTEPVSEFSRNSVFLELLDLFRSKHSSLVGLLLGLGDVLLPLPAEGKWRLAHAALSVLTDFIQNDTGLLITAGKLLLLIASDSLKSPECGEVVQEISLGVARLRESLGITGLSASDAIAFISENWKELKSRWTQHRPPAPIDCLSADPTDPASVTETAGARLQHYMLLCNLKAALTNSQSAFSLEGSAPVFLSYQSTYNWKEGETYEVPMSSLYQCTQYLGALRAGQVLYIMDDDYFFILLKPNQYKLGVAEVVLFQALPATSFQLVRENSHRISVHLVRERPVDITLRFEDPAKAWDVLDSLSEKQQQAVAFEKSLVNSLLLE